MPLSFLRKVTKYTVTVIFELIPALPVSCVKQDMYHTVHIPVPSIEETFEHIHQCEAKLTGKLRR